MPFFDNTGLDLEVKRGPLWGAFASLFEQLERMIMLNIVWALQLVPAMLTAIFPDWPNGLRILLLIYSGLALAVLTGLLYGLADLAVRGVPIRLELAREQLMKLATPALLTLVPLYGTFGILIGLIVLLNGRTELFLVEIATRLIILLLLACSMYWGPLFAEAPDASALTIGRRSLALFWNQPGRSLLLVLMVGFVAAIGAVSIGGIFLVVPVLIALLQVHMYQVTVRRN